MRLAFFAGRAGMREGFDDDGVVCGILTTSWRRIMWFVGKSWRICIFSFCTKWIYVRLGSGEEEGNFGREKLYYRESGMFLIGWVGLECRRR